MTPARRRFRELQAERTARRHDEFRLADVVVANSSLTASSWAAAGLDGSKIHVATYGAPEPVSAGLDGGSREQGPLRFVWAGTFSIRKGAHYLLEAWRRWNPGNLAQLDVYGSPRLPTGLLESLPPGITLHGAVPRGRLLDEFLAADMLVFPTLCDGFGLVVTEALSRGLPVLTTRQAGASDLIRDRANGLIVESRDAAQLEGALDWALRHREELRAMRAEALRTAQECQWPDYRRRLRTVVEPLLQ
jgi:glycosyltransferase involved in cell wall biosynthesis